MRIAGDTQKLDVVDANLCGSVFDDVNLTGARFHNTKMQDVTIEESCIAGMRINGILVTDLLELYDAAQAAGSNNG